MRSILWQLSRYNKPPEGPKDALIVPEQNVDVPALHDIDVATLRKRISKGLCRQSRVIDRFYPYPTADVLYPAELQCVYELFYAGQLDVFMAERLSDEWLHAFAKSRMESPEAYAADLKRHASRTSINLAALRLLRGTFSSGKDGVDPLLRPGLCSFLNIDPLLSEETACVLLETAAKKATVEDQIIGRIGYFMARKQAMPLFAPHVLKLLTHERQS